MSFRAIEDYGCGSEYGSLSARMPCDAPPPREFYEDDWRQDLAWRLVEDAVANALHGIQDNDAHEIAMALRNAVIFELRRATPTGEKSE